MTEEADQTILPHCRPNKCREFTSLLPLPVSILHMHSNLPSQQQLVTFQDCTPTDLLLEPTGLQYVLSLDTQQPVLLLIVRKRTQIDETFGKMRKVIKGPKQNLQGVENEKQNKNLMSRENVLSNEFDLVNTWYNLISHITKRKNVLPCFYKLDSFTICCCDC